MGSSALPGVLRLYVPSGARCDGLDQETLSLHTPGAYSIICSNARRAALLSAVSGSATDHRQIGISWEGSQQRPVPAKLAQLETDVQFHKVQVYFCSPCWHRANVLAPGQSRCTIARASQRPEPKHTQSQTSALYLTVASQLRLVQYCCKRWTPHPLYSSAVACFFSTPSTVFPEHEWFSMTVRTIKRRCSGCVALSFTECELERASMMWQAIGSAALSYAAAWWLAALLPLHFSLDNDRVDSIFQQGHDWLSWCGIEPLKYDALGVLAPPMLALAHGPQHIACFMQGSIHAADAHAHFQLCRLCKEPGGFKVHEQWASTLAQPGHTAISAARVLVLAAAENFHTVCKSISWIARLGGVQLALCAVADIVFALMMPLVFGLVLLAAHKMSTVMQRWQLSAVALTWDMVRNRVNARRQLRALFRDQLASMRRPLLRLLGRGVAQTTCASPQNVFDVNDLPVMEDARDKDVIVEQMLVGMLFLAPMAATLPTTWLLHCVAALVHAIVAMLRVCAYAAACFLDSGCAYRLLRWAGQPLFGGAALGAAPDVQLLDTHTVSVVPAGTACDDVCNRAGGSECVRSRRVHQLSSSHDVGQAVPAGGSSHGIRYMSQERAKRYSCPVSYYSVDAGYVPILDALRPGLDVMMREVSFMLQWFEYFHQNQTVT